MENKKVNNNITEEDLQAIGEENRNLRADKGDDRLLRERNDDVDFAGKELDVPGRAMDEPSSRKAIKDEENQMYALGSDDNEDLDQTID